VLTAVGAHEDASQQGNEPSPLAFTSELITCLPKHDLLRTSFARVDAKLCSDYRVNEQECEEMKIGELAVAGDTTVEAIRFYEREGLLPPPRRTEGNYRDFDAEHVERLSFIRRCRSLNIGLDDIRTLLRFRDDPCGRCDGVDRIIDERIAGIGVQIDQLQALQRQLVELRATCPGERLTAECNILLDLKA
jgi:Cd(II)/Pb(II)-responsive transcriptional regulator